MIGGAGGFPCGSATCSVIAELLTPATATSWTVSRLEIASSMAGWYSPGGSCVGVKLAPVTGDREQYLIAYMENGETSETVTYDLSSRTFTSAGRVRSHPNYIHELVATPRGGALLVGGPDGRFSRMGRMGLPTLNFDAVDFYDPASGSWRPEQPLPVPLCGQAVVRLKGIP